MKRELAGPLDMLPAQPSPAQQATEADYAELVASLSRGMDKIEAEAAAFRGMVLRMASSMDRIQAEHHERCRRRDAEDKALWERIMKSCPPAPGNSAGYSISISGGNNSAGRG